jgi:hypothetical protein
MKHGKGKITTKGKTNFKRGEFLKMQEWKMCVCEWGNPSIFISEYRNLDLKL